MDQLPDAVGTGIGTRAVLVLVEAVEVGVAVAVVVRDVLDEVGAAVRKTCIVGKSGSAESGLTLGSQVIIVVYMVVLVLRGQDEPDGSLGGGGVPDGDDGADVLLVFSCRIANGLSRAANTVCQR